MKTAKRAIRVNSIQLRFAFLLVGVVICDLGLSSCVRFSKMGELDNRIRINKQENVEVQKLTGSVNTSSNEMAPFIYSNGKTLYFSRMTGFMKLDILRADINQGQGSNVKKMDSPMNQEDLNLMGSITPDGEAMVFAKSHKMSIVADAGEKKGDTLVNLNQGIILAKKTANGWELIEALDPFSTYKGDGGVSFVTYQDPYLTPDKKKLYFSCNPQGIGFGQWDIWLMEKDANNKWGVPKNLGEIINTPADESAPFLSPNGRTLYFASNGHPGIGKNDIFRSTLVNNEWTTPELLGMPISSSGQDGRLSIAGDGKTAYFFSDREGNGDIYMTTLPKIQLGKPQNTSQQPIVSLILSGTVKDALTLKALESAIIIRESGNLADSTALKSDKKNGAYEVSISSGKNYSLWAHKKGYLFSSSVINTHNKLTTDRIINDILLMPIAKGSKLILNNLLFDFDSDEIRPESDIDLQKVLELIKENPKYKFEIVGHTDNVGTRDYNTLLSQKRAEAVKKRLVNAGINAEILICSGKGSSQPIASNDTEKGRELNRRVELIIR